MGTRLPKRIQHFLKVHAFSAAIAKGEGADDDTMFLIESLGYIHDIGIRIAEEKDGKYNGKNQELYGEPAAREMLTELGYEQKDIDRISMIVGKHHTYNEDIEGLDFRVLLEADACVNMFEKDKDDNAKLAMLKNVFRTGTGRKIYCGMFGLDTEEPR